MLQQAYLYNLAFSTWKAIYPRAKLVVSWLCLHMHLLMFSLSMSLYTGMLSHLGLRAITSHTQSCIRVLYGKKEFKLMSKNVNLFLENLFFEASVAKKEYRESGMRNTYYFSSTTTRGVQY
jgi:hypothetical protein